MVHLHVVPGESAVGALRRALGNTKGQMVLGLHDSLSCGPLRNTTTVDEWTITRRKFWGEVLGRGPDDFEEVVPDARLLQQAESITLWLGGGLSDQITLPWFCWLLRLLAIQSDQLRVVQFSRDAPPEQQATSVGMLSRERIRNHPVPRALADREVDAIDCLWNAITNHDPRILESLIDDPRLEEDLRRALSRLAWRYPDAETGLSFWDRTLLENSLKDGPNASHVVALTLGGPGWDADPVGDKWLFWRLRRLGSLRVPFVTLGGDTSALRSTSVEITTAGRQVLDGSQNALELNDVDDWIAGVHLDSSIGGTWVTSHIGPTVASRLATPPSGLQLTWRLPPFARGS